MSGSVRDSLIKKNDQICPAYLCECMLDVSFSMESDDSQYSLEQNQLSRVDFKEGQDDSKENRLSQIDSDEDQDKSEENQLVKTDSVSVQDSYKENQLSKIDVDGVQDNFDDNQFSQSQMENCSMEHLEETQIIDCDLVQDLLDDSLEGNNLIGYDQEECDPLEFSHEENDPLQVDTLDCNLIKSNIQDIDLIDCNGSDNNHLEFDSAKFNSEKQNEGDNAPLLCESLEDTSFQSSNIILTKELLDSNVSENNPQDFNSLKYSSGKQNQTESSSLVCEFMNNCLSHSSGINLPKEILDNNISENNPQDLNDLKSNLEKCNQNENNPPVCEPLTDTLIQLSNVILMKENLTGDDQLEYVNKDGQSNINLGPNHNDTHNENNSLEYNPVDHNPVDHNPVDHNPSECNEAFKNITLESCSDKTLSACVNAEENNSQGVVPVEIRTGSKDKSILDDYLETSLDEKNSPQGCSDERSIRRVHPLIRNKCEKISNGRGIRILRVLIRRLEDETFWLEWKKTGVLSSQIIGVKSFRNETKRKSSRKSGHYCRYCKKCIQNKERFLEHRASKCDKVAVFGCDKCDRKYILKRSLDEHKAKCILLNMCNICKRVFSSQERLNEHVKSKCDTQKIFHCNICQRGFIFKRLFIIHCTPVCTSLRRFECSYCYKSFTKNELKIHKRRVHGIGQTYILCEFCGKMITYRTHRDHLRLHIDSPPLQCPECDKCFKTKGSLQSHKFTHISKKPFICGDCGKSFKRLMFLKHHISGSGRAGSISTFFTCNVCNKVIRNKLCFQDHLRGHIKENINVLEIKHEEYTSDLLEFENSPKMEDLNTAHEYASDIVKFDNPSPEMQNLNTVPNAVSTNSNVLSPVNNLNCFICEKIFSKRRNLLRHIRYVHRIFRAVPVTEKPWACISCGNCFSRKINLKRHMRRIHGKADIQSKKNTFPVELKPYACVKCGNYFSNNKNLKRHVRRIHGIEDVESKNKFVSIEEKPYSCLECGKCFSNKVYLNRHLKCVHHILGTLPLLRVKNHFLPEIKPYICDKCNKCFSARRHLSRHQRNVHLNNKFVCNLCQNSFKTEYILNRHINGHIKQYHQVRSESKERFACKECGRVVSTFSSLKRHYLSHRKNLNNPPKLRVGESGVETPIQHLENHEVKLHSQSPSNLHACEECGKSFKEKWLLNKHLTTHSKKSYVCNICKKLFVSQLKLSIHMLVHGVKIMSETDFKCRTCSKLFGSNEKLQEHSLICTGEKPYKWGENLTIQSSIKQQYTETTHSGKHFACTHCKMSFQAFSSLNRHIMYVHKKSVSLTDYVWKIGNEMNVRDSEPEHFQLGNIEETEGKENPLEKIAFNVQPEISAEVNNMFFISNFCKSLEIVSEVVYNPDTAGTPTIHIPEVIQENSSSCSLI